MDGASVQPVAGRWRVHGLAHPIRIASTVILVAVAGCAPPAARDAELSESRDAQPIPREQPPASASPPEFALVASRNGDIGFHRAWDDTGNQRMILVATLPYPFADGAVQTLPRVYDGLIGPGEDASLDADVAGGFFGPGDGWLTLSTDPEMPNYVGIPLTYQWKAPGWQLLRQPHGGFTELHSHYISRGSTVFAQTRYVRLATPTEILVVDGPALRRGAPPSKLVRLRGQLPQPDLVDVEQHPHHRDAWATTANGALYQAAFVPEPGRDTFRVELLEWAPDQATSRSTPLPDSVSLTKRDVYRSRLTLTTTEHGVLIAGNIPIDGHPEVIAYLSVGQPNELTRLALECDGAPCTGELTSAAIGPDGDYWLAIDGSLHSLDSRGVLRPRGMPDISAVHNVEQLREYPAKLEDIERVGDDLWLRLVSSSDANETITAVFKTGASAAPVLLPSRESVLNEIEHRQ